MGTWEVLISVAIQRIFILILILIVDINASSIEQNLVSITSNVLIEQTQNQNHPIKSDPAKT